MSNFLNIILDVLQGVTILYVGIFTGWLFIISPLRKYRSQFVWIIINIAIPILTFISMLTIQLDSQILYPVVAAILVTFFGIYVPKILSKLIRKEDPSPAEICTATFPNALNYPFPVIYQFAPLGLGIASIFVALTTLGRNTIGFWIAGTKIDSKAMKTIITFPPVWGIIIGALTNFLFTDFGRTLIALEFIQWTLEIGIFLTVMTVGFGLVKPKIKYIWPIFRVAFTRFLFMGIIGTTIIIFFQPPLYVAITVLVQMTAPPAVYNGIYAEELGLDTELTSQLIVTLTLIALVILPLQLLFIQFLI